MINIYLDIDGVLLIPDYTNGDKWIPDIENIFKYLTENFNCFWLSTHSHHGKLDTNKLFYSLPKDNLKKYFEKIKSPAWNVLKTEAIDFSMPFIWIEDQPLASEIEVLKQHGCSESLLLVNIKKDRLTLEKIKEYVSKVSLAAD